MFKIIIQAFQMDINCILIRDRPIYRLTDIFPDI